jgi:hypothetical protein
MNMTQEAKIIKNFNDNKEAPSSWPGGVCGATYTRRDLKHPPKTALKGIRYFNKPVGTPFHGPRFDLDHVKTQNGTITIMVQHEW